MKPNLKKREQALKKAYDKISEARLKLNHKAMADFVLKEIGASKKKSASKKEPKPVTWSKALEARYANLSLKRKISKKAVEECGRLYKIMRECNNQTEAFKTQNKRTILIMEEVYKAMRKLGANSDLLGIIGSFGDTLTDQEVLEFLTDYNEHGTIWSEIYTKVE